MEAGREPGDPRVLRRPGQVRHERLARLLEIPPATLDASRGHRDRGTSPVRVTSPVSPAWLRTAVEELCAPHAARLFPETDRG